MRRLALVTDEIDLADTGSDGRTDTGPVSASEPRPRTRLRNLFVRAALAVAVATTFVGVSSSVLASTVDVYLPPDGAHYIADADSLLGDGVREIQHPPLFPGLVAMGRLIFGDVGGFQAAMAISAIAFGAAMYIFLRGWIGPGLSLLGALAGLLMPPTAELIGWGGGATMLGAAFFVLTLAAFDAWIAGLPSGALTTGLVLGATALCHPFIFAVTLVCLGMRWLWLLGTRRRFGLGSDPLGLSGVALAALPVLALGALAAPYYTGVEGGGGFGLGLPDFGRLGEFLAWAIGSHPLVWVVLATSVVVPVVTGHDGLRSYVGTLVVLTIGMSTVLAANMSYVTRIAYLFPLPVAVGVGVGLHALLRRSRRAGRRLPRRVGPALAVTLIVALALSGFLPRLERAVSFYALLDDADVSAISDLEGRPGVVATSWHGPHYGSGVSTSWFVEGIGKRPAFGPTAPWLSNVDEQRVVGSDMQRLFAGTEGLENGALQIVGGAPGMRADPAIQVRSGDFYFPLLYGNALVNSYPGSFVAESERFAGGSEMRWRFLDEEGTDVLSQEVHLQGRSVIIQLELASRYASGDWSMWLWPAYGVHWSDVRGSHGVVEATRGLPDEDIGFQVSSEQAEVIYHPVEARFQVPAIEIRATDAREVSVRIDVDATAAPGTVDAFDEGTIIERHDVRDVVLWKDTGWRDRFERDPCFLLRDETESLLLFAVVPTSCTGAIDG